MPQSQSSRTVNAWDVGATLNVVYVYRAQMPFSLVDFCHIKVSYGGDRSLSGLATPLEDGGRGPPYAIPRRLNVGRTVSAVWRGRAQV